MYIIIIIQNIKNLILRYLLNISYFIFIFKNNYVYNIKTLVNLKNKINIKNFDNISKLTLLSGKQVINYLQNISNK